MTPRGSRLPPGSWSLVLVAAFLLYECGGLPADFEALPLEEKVAAYERHWATGGTEIRWARMHIAWHGWEAANLMAEYVKGDKVGIPIYEALVIIREVQRRGCSLQGTAAESAVEGCLKTAEGLSPERLAAVNAIEMIRADTILDSEDLFLKGGPCQPEKASVKERQ